MSVCHSVADAASSADKDSAEQSNRIKLNWGSSCSNGNKLHWDGAYKWLVNQVKCLQNRIYFSHAIKLCVYVCFSLGKTGFEMWWFQTRLSAVVSTPVKL